MTDAIAQNLSIVRTRIAAAANRVGRDPGSVALVAVSKTFDAAAVAAAIAAGQRVFGENRVQEAAGKFPALKASHPDIELHLIGPLQTNKTRDAVALFDVIQSLDRDRLAQSLAAEMARSGRRPRLYVQVNIGAEPQKSGVSVEALPGLLAQCAALGLAIEGLMCIPPADQPPEPYFDRLAELARANGLAGLSMGMSGDYPAAIAAGATLIRVGSAIFGGRSAAPG
jgi:pyridoxal phosphate enzyme (YggS family)